MKIISEYPIDESILQTVDAILEIYNIAFSIKINKDTPIILLTSSKPKTCRFCGKSYPQVTFKKRAHTPPEFTGNKEVFSAYECDSCNEKYFNLFENALANFLLPFSSLSGKKVKRNKIPKYKQKGEPIITHKENLISITNISENRIKMLGDDSLEMSLRLPSYIPEYVYRCLVKICLSLMPEKMLSNYEMTLKWLMNLNQESDMRPGMMFSSYPNNLQLDDISVTLFERKETSKMNIPYSVFCLSYNNYAFQTFLPFSLKEKQNVIINGFPFILPTAFDLDRDKEIPRSISVIDLSSKEKKSNEILTLNIKGDQISKELKNTKR